MATALNQRLWTMNVARRRAIRGCYAERDQPGPEFLSVLDLFATFVEAEVVQLLRVEAGPIFAVIHAASHQLLAVNDVYGTRSSMARPMALISESETAPTDIR